MMLGAMPSADAKIYHNTMLEMKPPLFRSERSMIRINSGR
ncbi:hypothetical protein SXCC_00330 [Gluconacetobacter sp. SXCC-1]|nr:hypothetical protein SXCC_00330 [Gluconacetobacter sp. SXCC-1]